jgi:hypothetical protein
MQATSSLSARRLLALACATIAPVAVLGACGKGSATRSHAGAKAAGRPAAQGAGVPATAVTVIAGWADALRHGRQQRAAAYWAHPSAMVNGPDASGRVAVIHIDSDRDALLADRTLSCGATLVHTMRRGAYVRATFTLSVRTGPGADSSGCSGPASVDFLIRDAHIVRWLRAPVASPAPPSGEQPGAGAAPGAQPS